MTPTLRGEKRGKGGPTASGGRKLQMRVPYEKQSFTLRNSYLADLSIPWLSKLY